MSHGRSWFRAGLVLELNAAGIVEPGIMKTILGLETDLYLEQ